MRVFNDSFEYNLIPPVAVLYQSHHPPAIDNIRKPMKPTGYKDSSADIAYGLTTLGVRVITPKKNPNPKYDSHWCFPDSNDGIKEAYNSGARIFWLNTVLYATHPITNFFNLDIAIVGQHPECVHKYDNKFVTNQILKKNSLPIPNEKLLSLMPEKASYEINMLKLNDKTLKKNKFIFPLVIKPLRGRGSQGVFKLDTFHDLLEKANYLFNDIIEIGNRKYSKYGNKLILEEFLSGEEITVSIMPPGIYFINNKKIEKLKHWALPIVKRFGHFDGIAPYNGVIAVAENSILLNSEEINKAKYEKIISFCEKAAEIINAKAPIRIDCRFGNKEYLIFDLNLKPNMTGNIRTHRKNQNGLIAISAKGINWDYKNLIFNILIQNWSPKNSN